MKRFLTVFAAAAWLSVTAIGYAQSMGQEMKKSSMSSMHGDQESAKTVHVTRAVAVLNPTEGNSVHGMVTFDPVEGGIHVVAEVFGLKPGTKHGFHIHQWGNCTAMDGSSAGGHFNPSGMKHGGPSAEERHEGDMGNLVVGEDGVGRVDYVDSHLSFSGSTSIIGRGVVVHAGEDDLTSQPTGAAGARVACGVIGIAATEK